MYYNNVMISCSIPGRGTFEIEHIVLDVNGTLTQDGILMEGVVEAFASLKDLVNLHLISADTLGTLPAIEHALSGSLNRVVRLTPGGEAEQKLEFIELLGMVNVAAIGQGTNDRLMLKGAGLGICVLSTEGTAVETMLSADILVPDILSALGLFLHPSRLKATLRQ